MKLSRFYIHSVVLIMLPLMVSCMTELCYNHYSSVELSLDWEQEWERDYGKHHAASWDAEYHGVTYEQLRPGIPEWVNMLRFTSDGDEVYENFIDPEGSKVIVGENTDYSFLLYNGDTQYIHISPTTHLPEISASATSRSRASLTYMMNRHPGVRSTNPPDVIYSAYVDYVPGVKYHEVVPCNVKMQPLVFTYVVRCEFEYGIEHVALARGALGGMAESVYLLDGRTSEESSIILYDCNIHSWGCDAYVRSFGVPGLPDKYYGQPTPPSSSDSRTYSLNLEVRLRNGNYVEFNYDITDQIVNQPRGGVIMVSGLRIEDGDSFSDAGFDIEIDDWGERVDIDLPVGSSD